MDANLQFRRRSIWQTGRIIRAYVPIVLAHQLQCYRSPATGLAILDRFYKSLTDFPFGTDFGRFPILLHIFCCFAHFLLFLHIFCCFCTDCSAFSPMDNFSGPQKAAGSSFTLTLLKSLSLSPVERLKKYFLTKEKALQTFPENLGDTISLLHYLIEWLCSYIMPLFI